MPRVPPEMADFVVDDSTSELSDCIRAQKGFAACSCGAHEKEDIAVF